MVKLVKLIDTDGFIDPAKKAAKRCQFVRSTDRGHGSMMAKMGYTRTPDNAYLGWVPIRTGFGLFGHNGQIPVVRRPDKMSAENFKFLHPCPDKSRYFDRAHRSLSGQDLIKSDSAVVTLYVFVKILN